LTGRFGGNETEATGTQTSPTEKRFVRSVRSSTFTLKTVARTPRTYFVRRLSALIHRPYPKNVAHRSLTRHGTNRRITGGCTRFLYLLVCSNITIVFKSDCSMGSRVYSRRVSCGWKLSISTIRFFRYLNVNYRLWPTTCTAKTSNTLNLPGGFPVFR